MTASILAVGDGALRFWKVAREVFPRHLRAAVLLHKQADVVAESWPKPAHPAASAAINDNCNAEDIDHTQVATKAAFEVDYGANPKSLAKIVDDANVQL